MPSAAVRLSFHEALFATHAWCDLAAAALSCRDFRRAAGDLEKARAWFDVAVALFAIRRSPSACR